MPYNNPIHTKIPMKRKLLIVGIAIAMFPGFIKGIHYIKRDFTFLYCTISKSCNEPY